MLTVFTISNILQTNGLQCLLVVLLYPQPQPLLLQRDVQGSELLEEAVVGQDAATLAHVLDGVHHREAEFHHQVR